jgi:hypothetical protein
MYIVTKYIFRNVRQTDGSRWQKNYIYCISQLFKDCSHPNFNDAAQTVVTVQFLYFFIITWMYRLVCEMSWVFCKPYPWMPFLKRNMFVFLIAYFWISVFGCFFVEIFRTVSQSLYEYLEGGNFRRASTSASPTEITPFLSRIYAALSVDCLPCIKSTQGSVQGALHDCWGGIHSQKLI